jgi:hypothetical protein
MQNLTNNKIDQLQVKAKIMSKWFEWNALKELVTADVIQQGTLCKLLLNIEEKKIYEYDCWLWFEEVHYFYYNKIGYLELKCFDTNLLEIVEESDTSFWQVFTKSNEATFIGNWHDGQEYLLKKIKKRLLQFK